MSETNRRVGGEAGGRDELTGAVIGAAIEVHREIGPGLLESVYQACLEIELKLRGIEFVSQAKLPLVYKGIPLGSDDLRMDFFFPTSSSSKSRPSNASTLSTRPSS